MSRSLSPAKADLATRNDLRAHPRTGGDRQRCAACGSEIVENHWFCRLPPVEEPVLLCCPSCALQHFRNSQADVEGPDPTLAFGERTLHFFVNGENNWL